MTMPVTALPCLRAEAPRPACASALLTWLEGGLRDRRRTERPRPTGRGGGSPGTRPRLSDRAARLKTEIAVPWETLLLATGLYVVLPLVAGFLTRQALGSRDRIDAFTARIKALSALG